MDYQKIADELKDLIEGDVKTDRRSISNASTDASIFEVKPAIVIAPKNSKDVEKIVKYVFENKNDFPELSVTARGAGTCMSGGSLNESIILDMTTYMNECEDVSDEGTITVMPGAYYRDMEKKTLAKGLILPSYTASKNLCTVGGMVANNASGELSLSYGDTSKYVKELEVVLYTGKKIILSSLKKKELDEKLTQKNEEGKIYRDIVALIQDHFEDIRRAKPRVSKNSSGYFLWKLWNKDSLNLTQIFCGAQGTIGIITKITFNLIPPLPAKSLLVIPVREIAKLPNIINTVLTYKPESFESFDINTYNLAVKYLPESAKEIISDDGTSITLLAQFSGDSDKSAHEASERAEKGLTYHGIESKIVNDYEMAENYWNIRRSSFSLLKDHAENGERTVPCIDDIIVPPDNLPKFLPRLQSILSEYSFKYTIAGHIGNGNFHLIPLINIENEEIKKTIIDISRRVFALVLEYHGAISGEHNDGIIRTPFLKMMFGESCVNLFEKVKNIFDPKNIFNPGKKVGGSIDYAIKHISNKSGSL